MMMSETRFIPSYPYLAKLSCHHEGRHAIVVEHCLQVAVWVELGALNQQQVVHLREETGVVLGVVRDVHQGVQHRVSTGILAPQVGRLVRILRQVVHYVRLVGTRGQRERQFTWGRQRGKLHSRLHR